MRGLAINFQHQQLEYREVQINIFGEPFVNPSRMCRNGPARRRAANRGERQGAGLRTSLTIGIILTMVCLSNYGNTIWHVFGDAYHLLTTAISRILSPHPLPPPPPVAAARGTALAPPTTRAAARRWRDAAARFPARAGRAHPARRRASAPSRTAGRRGSGSPAAPCAAAAGAAGPSPGGARPS
eukprot:7390107-Prymnesium_polylepis.1